MHFKKRPKYDFTNGFQEKIASVILKDPTFLPELSDVVNENYFESETLSSIVKIALGYFRKKHTIPSKESLIQLITVHCEEYDVDEEIQEELLAEVEELYDIDISDSEFVKEEAANFGKYHSVRLGLMEVIDLFKDSKADPSKLDTAIPILQRSLMVGTGMDPGVQVYEAMEDLNSVREIIADPAYKVPTGFGTVDKCVVRGGLGAGELGIVWGRSGLGKSQVLVNLAVSASVRGRVVYYLTLELKVWDVLVRLLSRMTGLTNDEVERETPTYDKAIAKLRRKSLGNKYIRLKFFKPGSTHAGHLRSYIMRMMAMDNEKPDLIIVDYADEMTEIPSGYQKRRFSEEDSGTTLYMKYGSVYDNLISLGVDFCCPVWTASQIQRAGYEEDKPELHFAADSMKKVGKADVVLALCQSRKEERTNRMRFYFPKVRRGPAKRIVNCVVDFSRSTVREARRVKMKVRSE